MLNIYLDGYIGKLTANGDEKHFDLVEMMRGMVKQIVLWTEIPVSVGIARTKLHVRKDGQPVTSAQVYSVVMHHPNTFVKAEGR